MFKEREKALELSPSVTWPALTTSLGMEIASLVEMTVQMLGEKGQTKKLRNLWMIYNLYLLKTELSALRRCKIQNHIRFENDNSTHY